MRDRHRVVVPAASSQNNLNASLVRSPQRSYIPRGYLIARICESAVNIEGN
jgi:hypothetical protein